MTPYLWTVLLGTAVIFALYGLRLARLSDTPALKKRAWQRAGLTLVLSALFGLALARGFYALLMQELDFEYDGIAALNQLLEIEMDHLSFFGGAVGVCLGVLLANRLTGKNAFGSGMDAFAPFGALLVALYRIGEIFLGSWGTGTSLPEGSPFAFFPFALEIPVAGGYSYWSWAIFMLSAAFALVWAGISFFRLKGEKKRLNASLTLFFLALPQILCESLRRRGLLWLFVHVDQLLCGIVLTGVMIFWIVNRPDKKASFKAWLPLIVMLICFALLVGTEFAIDGKILDLPKSVCYLFLCAVVAVIGISGGWAAKRWRGSPRQIKGENKA